MVADDDGGYLRNFVGAYYASTVSYSLRYVFTWFDLLSDPAFQVDNIHVVNPSAGATVNVRVDIPGCGSQFGAISPAQKELIFSCPHGFGGPVVVNSDLPVIASQRVRYAASFNEVYAVPVTAAATTLYFQWYDLRSDPAFLADNVHVVAPTGANVRVSIPGCGVQAASLGTFQERYFSCAGGFGGPVVVSADQPVIASQRVEYGQTFNEIVGLPTSSAAAEIYLSWFDRAGNFHSDALHVVERFTARDQDHLNYEATIEDPKVFTRPWKMSMPLYRIVEKNAQILEFKCVEFAEDVIYGHLRKVPIK